MKEEIQAPVIAVSRHRMASDGQGVTTLVCFHGCPLRCKYCLNPFSFATDTKRISMTPETLYGKTRCDELYFLATGGGVTFGGGEPLLYAPFLKAFRGRCGAQWHLCAETSLAVPWENVEMAAECIDMFYVDCKDTDPQVYRAYTGGENAGMLENLRRLILLVGADRVVVRLPLIPGYNTEEHRKNSQTVLENMGVTQFDRFTYQTK